MAPQTSRWEVLFQSLKLFHLYLISVIFLLLLRFATKKCHRRREQLLGYVWTCRTNREPSVETQRSSHQTCPLARDENQLWQFTINFRKSSKNNFQWCPCDTPLERTRPTSYSRLTCTCFIFPLSSPAFSYHKVTDRKLFFLLLFACFVFFFPL